MPTRLALVVVVLEVLEDEKVLPLMVLHYNKPQQSEKLVIYFQFTYTTTIRKTFAYFERSSVQTTTAKQLTPSLLGTQYANNAPVVTPSPIPAAATEQTSSDAADEKKKINIFTDPVLLRNDVQELVQFTVNHLFVTLLSDLLVDDKEQQLMKALPPMNGVSTGKRVEIVENNETY